MPNTYKMMYNPFNSPHRGIIFVLFNIASAPEDLVEPLDLGLFIIGGRAKP